MLRREPANRMTAHPAPPATAPREFFGHPPALSYLFATEMWERFSYYGMRALLMLYMIKYLLLPAQAGGVAGLAGFKSVLEAVFGPLALQPLASQIYGFYTGLVYLTPIFGGLLADRLLGQRRTVILGASLMAAGHFLMAFERWFLLALLVLILGNGCFKPNISTQVGSLYAPGDHRRDRAFSIFYVGINLGAFLAPLVCGTLGETYGWHYGFAAAGVGMTLGLAIYLVATPTLPRDAFVRRDTSHKMDRAGWRAIGALLVLFIPVSLFWATYEQQGNTIALWADGFTDRHVFGAEIPVTWFQAFNPLMIFAFTPFIVALWRRQGETRALDRGQAGDRLLAQRRVVAAHGRGRAANGRRPGELALAVRLLRGDHRRRALSVAHQPLAGDQGRARRRAVDDDGRVAFDQLRRRISRRLSRHLLVGHEQARLLPDAGGHLGGRRPVHRAGEPSAARRAARLVIFFSKIFPEKRSPLFGIMRAAARHIARRANGRRIPRRSDNRDRPTDACGRRPTRAGSDA